MSSKKRRDRDTLVEGSAGEPESDEGVARWTDTGTAYLDVSPPPGHRRPPRRQPTAETDEGRRQQRPPRPIERSGTARDGGILRSTDTGTAYLDAPDARGSRSRQPAWPSSAASTGTATERLDAVGGDLTALVGGVEQEEALRSAPSAGLHDGATMTLTDDDIAETEFVQVAGLDNRLHRALVRWLGNSDAALSVVLGLVPASTKRELEARMVGAPDRKHALQALEEITVSLDAGD